jgi:hypothetical protein
MKTNKKIRNEIVTMREALRLFATRDGVVYLVDFEYLDVNPLEESVLTLGDMKNGYENGTIIFIHQNVEREE